MQLVLGTAQLGLDYGVTNNNGKPKLTQSLEIIKHALDNDINIFDTARAYGDGEYILGLANKKYNNLNIITKLDPLNELNDTKSIEEIYEMIDNSINTSLKNLNIDIIDTFILHRFHHFNNKIIWNYLLQSKKVKNLGVSIYHVEEGIEALKDSNIKHIQLPINILDQQWFCDEFLKLVKKRNDVTIHCRSILLQGILISDADKWPKIHNIHPKEFIKKLNELVKVFKLNSRLELCFSYVKSIQWIDGLLIGVDNLDQLNENLKLFNVRKLTSRELQLIKSTFKNTSRKLLNPALW